MICDGTVYESNEIVGGFVNYLTWIVVEQFNGIWVNVIIYEWTTGTNGAIPIDVTHSTWNDSVYPFTTFVGASILPKPATPSIINVYVPGDWFEIVHIG